MDTNDTTTTIHPPAIRWHRRRNAAGELVHYVDTIYGRARIVKDGIPSCPYTIHYPGGDKYGDAVSASLAVAKEWVEVDYRQRFTKANTAPNPVAAKRKAEAGTITTRDGDTITLGTKPVAELDATEVEAERAALGAVSWEWSDAESERHTDVLHRRRELQTGTESRCVRCGNVAPAGATYCRSACRQAAYRERKAEAAPAPVFVHAMVGASGQFVGLVMVGDEVRMATATLYRSAKAAVAGATELVG